MRAGWKAALKMRPQAGQEARETSPRGTARAWSWVEERMLQKTGTAGRSKKVAGRGSAQAGQGCGMGGMVRKRAGRGAGQGFSALRYRGKLWAAQLGSGKTHM